MNSRYALLWLSVSWLLCGGGSCGQGSPATPGSAGRDAADASSAPQCEGVPPFRIPMKETGKKQLVLAELVDGDLPHKYENAWVVKFTDPDGKELPGLELYKVEPYMPVHGHDGGFAPDITAQGEPGTYSVKRINMWMKDHWEVRFFLHVGDQDDEVIFNVCIPP